MGTPEERTSYNYENTEREGREPDKKRFRVFVAVYDCIDVEATDTDDAFEQFYGHDVQDALYENIANCEASIVDVREIEAPTVSGELIPMDVATDDILRAQERCE